MISKFFKILNPFVEEDLKIANQGLSQLKGSKTLTIGNYRVKIDRKIAEGGFADIFRVNDTSTFSDNMPYALKRMFISDKSKESALAVRQAFNQELEILQQFKTSHNLLKMVDFQEIKKKDGTEVFFLIEYCPNGTLFDLIESKCQIGLNGITDEQELYKVLNDVANGLRILHQNQIAHRDIKIENILKGSDQFWKICDFGSCTKI